MKYEKKNRIFIYIIILLAVLLFGTTVYGIYCTNKLDAARATNDQLTERLSDATDTNRRLTETVEQCQFIVTELGSTTDRSIGTVREAIEVIEETREAVGALEVELGIWDSDSVYGRIDSWLSSELKKQ
jgi:flagellar basal body-associated protein FliL